MSYDIKLYERKQLKARCMDKYPSLMWHGYLDQFEKDNPREFNQEENKLLEETMALALLASSNKHKYGHSIVELHDDDLKKNNHYPADMSAIYKLLDEHSNDKKAIDPNAAGSTSFSIRSTTGKF